MNVRISNLVSKIQEYMKAKLKKWVWLFLIPVVMLGGRAYYRYDKSEKLTYVLVREIDSRIVENLTDEDIQGAIRFYHDDPDLFANYIIELQRDSVTYNKYDYPQKHPNKVK